MPESKFTAEQAVEVAAAFAKHQVEYLFIGKSGAILLGYPAVTQDVDIFLPKDRQNADRECARPLRWRNNRVAFFARKRFTRRRL
jgi:hypothetical protein